MTITYTSEVASAKHFGIFWKLLFRWKGSIYKLIWPEMLIFIILYYSLRCVYGYALDDAQRKTFEHLSLYCQDFTNMIPLTFVLGFYVSIVMTRWWDQFMLIPWPDSLAVFVSTSVQGLDERGRLMRRTIMRYVNLSFVMTMAMISPGVKKRFPTKEHLVEAGFMTKSEKFIFANLDEIYNHPKFWMPLVWAGTIVSRARKEGRIRDDFAVKTIVDEINTFRLGLGTLLCYDSVSVPLVYSQVVTLAVYTYFIGTLLARQHLDPGKKYPQNHIDLFVPWFTLLQFLFYMGWLKVAESLINPFGEDDDDFEINAVIDRNIQVSYLIVDGMHSEHPEMVQDKYWDEGIPQDLPYTIAAEQFKRDPHLGSTANMEVPQNQQFFIKEENIEEEDNESGIRLRNIKKADSSNDDKRGNSSKAIDIDLTDGLGARAEADLNSVLWVTSSAIPRNQSMLSLFKNPFTTQQTQHRKLSCRKSTSSFIGSSPLNKSDRSRLLEMSGFSKTQDDQEKNETILNFSLESVPEDDKAELCNKSESNSANVDHKLV